ncbi:MAG: aminoglycoside 6-adenylyltransferase [Clostridiales bacterium]|nr:aminoglycoside 6-adenylyltransferase [Clostridiales bacterium]
MRSEKEMMDLIMKKAIEDDRIRAVALDGSRVIRSAVHDKYSDFDIVYFVRDIREFTRDKGWINYFGDILIVQCPDDWYNHPYDYSSHDRFAYLMQFTDGNRIDLTLVDIRNIAQEKYNNEPRVILLNKDNYPELIPVEDEKAFYIQAPTQMEFSNTCNEFRWLSLYVAKGLCRKELYYAKYSYDVLMMDMFMKMLNWKVGTQYGFNITTGKFSKYLKRYLSDSEMKRLQGIFPNGEYKDIWDKLFIIYDYFHEIELTVAKYFGFSCDEVEANRVRDFLIKRRDDVL